MEFNTSNELNLGLDQNASVPAVVDSRADASVADLWKNLSDLEDGATAYTDCLIRDLMNGPSSGVFTPLGPVSEAKTKRKSSAVRATLDKKARTNYATKKSDILM
jgi:hypothetical protein